MGIALEHGAREQGGVVQTGVVEPVGEHRVVPVEKRGDDAEVGHVAGREEQRARHPDEFGEPSFQRLVGGVVAADAVRRTRADPQRRAPSHAACTSRGSAARPR